MSEELVNKQVKADTKKMPTTKKDVTKKSTTKKSNVSKIDEKKEELITAEYKYKVIGDEKLIMDKPSTPLKNVETLKEKKKNIQTSKPTLIQTNGQIYNAFIKELQNFKLIYNGDVIYDSTLSKTINNLKFESDYFVLFGKKYSYNGLRVQKI